MEDDQTPTNQRPSRRRGILIVDDEADIRELLSFAMKMAAFEVFLAADGMVAARIYRRQYKQIDIVLLDVQMPLWDGPRTLEVLQAFRPQVRCCFMSGDLGRYTEEFLRDAGALMVFQKPLSAAALGQTLMDLAMSPEPCPQAETAAAPNS